MGADLRGRPASPATGLIKVGQTTKASARERIKQQLGTAYPNLDGVEILLDEPAVRDDGTSSRTTRSTRARQGGD